MELEDHLLSLLLSMACGSELLKHELKLERLISSMTLTVWTSPSCAKTHCLGLQPPHLCSDNSLALSSECRTSTTGIQKVALHPLKCVHLWF